MKTIEQLFYMKRLMLLLLVLSFCGLSKGLELELTPLQQTYFNGRNQIIYDGKISGAENLTILFDFQGSTPNNFWDDLHSEQRLHNDNIASLHIKCKKLIIRGNLRLPETRLFLDAEELVFEKSSSLDLTPYSPDVLPGPGAPERHVSPALLGAKGGQLSLRVGKPIKIPRGETGPLFKSNGANGADATPGRDGQAFRRDPHTTSHCNENAPNCVYLGEHPRSGCTPTWDANGFGSHETAIGLAKDWMSGEKPVPASAPGKGGDGGDIYTTRDILRFVENRGGLSGKRGLPTVSGRNSTIAAIVYCACPGEEGAQQDTIIPHKPETADAPERPRDGINGKYQRVRHGQWSFNLED